MTILSSRETAVTVAKKYGNRVAAGVDNNDVWFAISVEITGRDCRRREASRIPALEREASVPVVKQNRNGVGMPVSNDKLRPGVVVEIDDSNGRWAVSKIIWERVTGRLRIDAGYRLGRGCNRHKGQ